MPVPYRKSAFHTNGDPAPGSTLPPPDAGVLRERVFTLERDVRSSQGEIHEIRSVMATSDDIRGVQASLASVASEMKNALATITGEMRNQGRPQWQALGVMLTGALAIGALVYWPIREKQGDQSERLSRLEQTYVPERVHQREWESRDRAVKELRDRTEENQKNLVTREVFSQTVNGVQRQLDEQRQAFGNTYSLRDALADMQRRLDRVETGYRKPE